MSYEAGPAAVRVTAAPALATGDAPKAHTEGEPAWSEDGMSLAFLSDAQTPGQIQVCRWQMNRTGGAAASRDSGGQALACTRNLNGQVSHPVWAKDSLRLAFLYVAGSTQGTGALVAYKPDAGVVGDVVEAQRIAVLDFDDLQRGGSAREVSPPSLYVYDYDWSPDGKAFAAEAVEGSGTNNYWDCAAVHDQRRHRRRGFIDLEARRCGWRVPRWSPDGKSIAVIHGIMSDEGQTGGDIYVVPAADGAAKNITPNLEGLARALAWRAPDGRLLFQEYVDGKTALVAVAAGGGGTKDVVGAERSSSLSCRWLLTSTAPR